MKLQIDTTNKIIRLEQSAKLTELFAIVKKLFPNDEWKQYSLEAVTVINNWHDPIPYVPYWWQIQHEWTICETTDGSGTFCIQSN